MCAVVAVLLLSLATLASAQVNRTCFQDSGAVLVTPQDGTYNADRMVFNEKVQNEPAAVAYAYSENQVQDLVTCARATGLKAVPRGGGHGYEG